MRVLVWLIVVVLLAWAGLQFWRAWRLGAFGSMGGAPRARRTPTSDAGVFNLPEGPDVTEMRSEPVLTQPAWANEPEPVFTPPPPAPASPFPPPAPPPFPPPAPNFAPQPVSMAPQSEPTFATPAPFAGGPESGAADEVGEYTTTHDEVLQMFGRDLRALRHAIEVQRNTLTRLEEDLHMLENHLNGRQTPARRS